MTADKKPISLSANKAVARAIKDLDVDVIAAYPITPQTSIIEEIAEMIARGELDAQYIHVESEHSALSALIGASAMGARTFTATASQGLEFMHEVLHIASGLRLPIVMVVATRALSAPISIWNDLSDIMNARDTGWVIYFVSSAQEAYDTVIQAYRLAENSDVLLPVIVAYDGFLLSHTYEPVLLEDRDKVLGFSPKEWRGYFLDGGPVSLGTLASPDYYYEFKYQQVIAMENALHKAEEIDKSFENLFGRGYGLLETYKTEDAELILVAVSSLWTSLKYAVDKARGDGIRAGGIKIRLYRPMPVSKLRRSVQNAEVLCVLDKAISFGLDIAGPLANELKSNIDLSVKVKSVIVGIGQRSVTHEDLYSIISHVEKNKNDPEFTRRTLFYGVRGVSS